MKLIKGFKTVSHKTYIDNSSAQMTIDYITGMSIFLLAVAFVFQFMYGLFTPFQSNSDEITLASDRASTILVDRLLAADGSVGSSVVDQGKLYYFNNTKLNQSNKTIYRNTLGELGLNSSEIIFEMNLSVARLNGNIMNSSGPVAPENIGVGQTRRLVLIVNSSTGYNESAFISVKVW
jgi:hypothetical protein